MLRSDVTRQRAGLGECSRAETAGKSPCLVDGLDVDLQSLRHCEASATLITLVGLRLTLVVGGGDGVVGGVDGGVG